MKTKNKKQAGFASLPKDYEALCRAFLPRPIHDKTEYEEMLDVAEAFAGFESRMTRDQDDYFALLTSLLEAWENENVAWKRKTPIDTLRHLLEDRAMSAADLSRILGASAKLGPMILRGVRAITADHARKLGAYFGVPGRSIYRVSWGNSDLKFIAIPENNLRLRPEGPKAFGPTGPPRRFQKLFSRDAISVKTKATTRRI